ncbi:hypothetical protein [Litorisediminicola beolgyonensis]|uniref:Uncharacterized protein n=1 Tax=Litorisediminicola beolgyonensis TaxID=1173614 RepID=A0ABW3ZIZ6_9RHOB
MIEVASFLTALGNTKTAIDTAESAVGLVQKIKGLLKEKQPDEKTRELQKLVLVLQDQLLDVKGANVDLRTELLTLKEAAEKEQSFQSTREKYVPLEMRGGGRILVLG